MNKLVFEADHDRNMSPSGIEKMGFGWDVVQNQPGLIFADRGRARRSQNI
jgi:hypothetical protein